MDLLSASASCLKAFVSLSVKWGCYYQLCICHITYMDLIKSDIWESTIMKHLVLLYSFVHTFFLDIEFKKMKPHENKLGMFRRIARTRVFWVQWKIKEWHLSFLSPRSKLLKKNRGCLKDKDVFKCFSDIPYTVLVIRGAWKLFNEIHVYTQCASGGLHMCEDLRWNELWYSKHPCLEKWNKHGNKCSRLGQALVSKREEGEVTSTRRWMVWANLRKAWWEGKPWRLCTRPGGPGE